MQHGLEEDYFTVQRGVRSSEKEMCSQYRIFLSRQCVSMNCSRPNSSKAERMFQKQPVNIKFCQRLKKSPTETACFQHVYCERDIYLEMAY